MDANDLKEKLVLVGVTAAVFLPLRLLVGQYLVEHWLGNLGIATLVSVVLAVLVKKGKLGAFGVIFRNQITKTLWGRSVKVIIVILVALMFYFGATILLIERGSTVYHDDKEILLQVISGSEPGSLKLNGPQMYDAKVFGLAQLQYMEYLFSISYALLNDAMHGWLINLHLILFVEQVEILGLLGLYRTMFRPPLIRA